MPDPRPCVAIVGVGRLGSAVCARLAGAGYAVRACDVRPDLRDRTERLGARWYDRAADAVADAGAVLTVLPGSPELRELMLGADGPGGGLLADLGAGRTWIDLTSAAPDLGRELAAGAAAHGVDYLDAPVGGGPSAVADATASLYVGGETDVLQRCLPLLGTFAAPAGIRHLGPSGAGYLTKLLVNVLWFGQAAALGEALLLATGAGLDLDRVHDALAASPASSAFVENYLPRLYAGDYLDTFALARCVEELESVVRFGEQTGQGVEFAEHVARLHRRAWTMFGDVDGELLGVRYLEEQAGRTLRRPDGPLRPD